MVRLRLARAWTPAGVSRVRAASKQLQLEKIGRLPGFNGPPLPAEQPAGVMLVGHNPVLSVLWTLMQGDSAGHPLIMGASQLVYLDVFAACHDGGAFVYTVEP